MFFVLQAYRSLLPVPQLSHSYRKTGLLVRCHRIRTQAVNPKRFYQIVRIWQHLFLRFRHILPDPKYLRKGSVTGIGIQLFHPSDNFERRSLRFLSVLTGQIFIAPYVFRKAVYSDAPAILLAGFILSSSKVPYTQICLHLQPCDFTLEVLFSAAAKSSQLLHLKGVQFSIRIFLRKQIHDLL